jgi:hypothetical protein
MASQSDLRFIFVGSDGRQRHSRPNREKGWRFVSKFTATCKVHDARIIKIDTFYIPPQTLTHVTIFGIKETHMTDKRVLVADDSEAIREMLGSFLANLGYHTDLTTDGQTAIDLFKVHPYDVVICDLQMPRIEGL